PVLDQILDTWGETLGVCRAYLDDIIISGPVGVLFEFLRNSPTVLQRGLTIRPDKCCIFMPNQGIVDGLGVQYDIPADIQLVTAAGGITALGVPIGADDYVERFLRDVGESLRQFGDELEGLQHGQLELLLYTYSGGCKRIMHLFRCLPSEKLLPVADVCNQETMRLLHRLTAPTDELTEHMQAQASLPRRYGGLGLTDIQHVENAAFIAASVASLPSDSNAQPLEAASMDPEFITALTLFNELVDSKDRMTCSTELQQRPSQRVLTDLVFRRQFDILASDGTHKDVARLKEQASCGASSWLQPTFIRTHSHSC
ncbi:MAG: hypothetical protein ACAH88_03020, partial [Roseimicrobium sp.]